MLFTRPILLCNLMLWVCVWGNYLWLEQVLRQETLISACNRNVTRKKLFAADLDHLIVDHAHKLLYCYVPKVACTNWKRVFMALTGKATTYTNLLEIPGSVAHADNSTLKLSQLSSEEAAAVLASYTNFLVVRHPFERLLSAYRNKFEATYSSYFQLRYGRDIIKRYRNNATDSELTNATDVTFREFVLYLFEEGLGTNEHWTSIYDLCHPCTINYTFVGKHETMSEDARAILELIGMAELQFPVTRSSNTGLRLRRYFQPLSMAEIEQLYKLYELDFRLFGYDLESLLGYDLS